jgi:hypothetical protein
VVPFKDIKPSASYQSGVTTAKANSHGVDVTFRVLNDRSVALHWFSAPFIPLPWPGGIQGIPEQSWTKIG